MRLRSYKEKDDVISICAIDPGTNTMGYSILLVNLSDFTIEVDHSVTFVASKAIRSYGEVTREKRLKWLEDKLVEEFNNDEPDYIIMESAFANRRRITAFEALIECRVIITNAVERFDSSREILLIDPISVKYGIGAMVRGTKRPKKKGKKVDTKDLVRKVIKEDKDLKWNNINIDDLDQHEVDSIGVGIYLANSIIESEINHIETIKSMKAALC